MNGSTAKTAIWAILILLHVIYAQPCAILDEDYLNNSKNEFKQFENSLISFINLIRRVGQINLIVASQRDYHVLDTNPHVLPPFTYDPDSVQITMKKFASKIIEMVKFANYRASKEEFIFERLNFYTTEMEKIFLADGSLVNDTWENHSWDNVKATKGFLNDFDGTAGINEYLDPMFYLAAELITVIKRDKEGKRLNSTELERLQLLESQVNEVRNVSVKNTIITETNKGATNHPRLFVIEMWGILKDLKELNGTRLFKKGGTKSEINFDKLFKYLQDIADAVKDNNEVMVVLADLRKACYCEMQYLIHETNSLSMMSQIFYNISKPHVPPIAMAFDFSLSNSSFLDVLTIVKSHLVEILDPAPKVIHKMVKSVMAANFKSYKNAKEKIKNYVP